MSEIDQRLRELRRELRGMSWRRRRRVLAEARDHLLSALDDGLTEAEAIARLGEPGVSFAGLPGRRVSPRLAVVAAPLVLLALAPSLDGTLQRLGAGTPPSQAAAPPMPTKGDELAAVRRCVAAWNAEARGRYRAVAARAGIQRAWVGAYWTGKLPQTVAGSPVRIGGCTVSLRPALVASPYQRWIDVYAKPVGKTFRFDRLLRGRARSVAPAINARVDPSGRLVLSSRLLPAICPAGPIGSRVVSVQALPDRIMLQPGSTVRLHAGRRQSFVIVIRNVGRVAIHGAIGSLEISSPLRPGRALWRSGPRVVRELDPGVSVSQSFTPPAVGHGVRLLRATTAAIACETRVADNSPVFRVSLR